MFSLDPEVPKTGASDLFRKTLPPEGPPEVLRFPLPIARLDPQQRVQLARRSIDRAAERIEIIKNLGDHASYEQSVLQIAELFVDIRAIANLSFALVDLDHSSANEQCRTDLQEIKRELEASVFQDPELYAVVSRFAAPEARAAQSPAENRLLDNTLHDFKEHGVHLDAATRNRLKALSTEIDHYSGEFLSNLRMASEQTKVTVTDRELLVGLPAHLIESAKTEEGDWVFGVGDDDYFGVMQHASKAALRKSMYEAFKTRCSSGELDNEGNMRALIRLRRERAKLLGYDNTVDHQNCDYSLKTAAEIEGFLAQITEAAAPAYHAEMGKLSELRREIEGADSQSIEPWDELYYRRLLRERAAGINTEELKYYFELNGALERLFNLVRHRYGMEIVEMFGIEAWHPDVRTFVIYDEDHTRLGFVYMDLFSRPNKFDNGACLQPVIDPRDDGDQRVPAVAILSCNFRKPEGTGPCFLSHEEFTGVLLHEFFHTLHFCGARVSRPSEMDGVEPFDFLETPSQFGENYGWSKSSLHELARHYHTAEPLSEAAVDALVKSRALDAGCVAMNDVANAAMDVALHHHYDPDGTQSIPEYVDALLVPLFAGGPRLSTRPGIFEHIFVEEYGYDSRYYVYLFTAVLEADLFEQIELRRKTESTIERMLYQEVLAPGNSRDPIIGVRKLLGREPSAEAWGRRLLSS
ncbi:MAG: hypothetical protein K1X83_02285 [Oligoflexia bacterium]|nr:hypothetical protein [Oligoflexia bacterium]